MVKIEDIDVVKNIVVMLRRELYNQEVYLQRITSKFKIRRYVNIPHVYFLKQY